MTPLPETCFSEGMSGPTFLSIGAMRAATCEATDAEIIEALDATMGDVSETARILDVRRAALQARIDSNPALLAIMAELDDEIIDKSVKNIRLAVLGGSVAQSQFIVTTLGKNRGYSTRQETTGKDGADLPMGDITITFKKAENASPPVSETAESSDEE